MDPDGFYPDFEIEKARKKKKENKRFFKKLKKKPEKELDKKIHQFHREAFERIDCLQCANCCKTTSPIFRERDIDRLSKRLDIKPSHFISQYLKEDVDGDLVLKSSPCPFLEKDNKCAVYEDRPKACREYPHTDRKRVHQILDITKRNAQICPAVSEIVEKLKNTDLGK